MDDSLKLLTAIAAVIAIATGIVAFWHWNRKRNADKADSERLYQAIKNAKEGVTFRSTHALAATTKLPDGRVAELCARHPNIRRNEKEKQSWRLVEED